MTLGQGQKRKCAKYVSRKKRLKYRQISANNLITPLAAQICIDSETFFFASDMVIKMADVTHIAKYVESKHNCKQTMCSA